MSSQNPSIDEYEDHPLYRDILKSILKSQIQSLVDQLSAKIGEETVVLTASLDNGSITNIGTECGLDFIRDNKDIKTQFMGFCISRRFSSLKDEAKPNTDCQNISNSKKSQNKKAIKSLLQTPSCPLSPQQSTDHIGQNVKQKYINGHGAFNADKDVDTAEQTIMEGSGHGEMDYNGEKIGVTETKNQGNPKRKDPSSSSLPDRERPNHSSKSLDLKPSRRKQKPPKRLKTNHTDSARPTTNVKDSSNNPSVTVPLYGSDALGSSSEIEPQDLKQEYTRGDNDGMNPLSGCDKYLWNLNLMTDEQIPRNSYGNGEFIIPGASSSDYNVDPSIAYPSSPSLLKNSPDLSSNGFGKIGNMKQLRASSNDHDAEDDLMTSIDSQLKERALLKYDSFDLPYKVSTPSLSKEEVQAMRKAMQNQNMGTNENSSGTSYDKKTPPPASSKNPVCGLLVSRGPGRLEKMLKCELCGKICRTSNMSRHKKRYCLGYPKIRLSFPQ